MKEYVIYKWNGKEDLLRVFIMRRQWKDSFKGVIEEIVIGKDTVWSVGRGFIMSGKDIVDEDDDLEALRERVGLVLL